MRLIFADNIMHLNCERELYGNLYVENLKIMSVLLILVYKF